MISAMTGEELNHTIGQLLEREKLVGRDLLLHLAELERRKWYVPLGYGSLRAYLQRHHGVERRSARRRARVATLLARFPAAEEYLRRQVVTESSLDKIAPYATDRNHIELLDGISGMSEDDAYDWVAWRFGLDKLRRLLLRVPQEFLDDLDHLRALYSHLISDGDCVEVLHAVIRRAIEELERKKAGNAGVRRPPAPQPVEAGPPAERAPETPPPAGAPGVPPATAAETSTRPARRVPMGTARRYIPRAIERAVWARDGVRCAYVGPSGVRCNSTWQLELDHVDAYALGGLPTVENLRVVCRVHNQHRADVVFGRPFMERMRRRRRTTGRGAVGRRFHEADRDGRPAHRRRG